MDNNIKFIISISIMVIGFTLTFLNKNELYLIITGLGLILPIDIASEMWFKVFNN